MTNEPVAGNGTIALILMFLAPVLGRWGIDASGATQVLTLMGGVISGLAAIWRIVAARAKVTPVANPKSADGTALVKAA